MNKEVFKLSTLNKNLEALEKINNKLVESIKEAKEPDWIDVISSKNGMPNIITKVEGKIINLYDIESPRKEAKSLTDINISKKEDTTIIIGAGLGYALEAVLQKKEKQSKVVLIEPNPYMLKLCFSRKDFYKYLMNGELFIIDGKEPMEISYVINTIDNSAMIANWNLIIERYARIRVLEYDKIISYTADIVNQLRCNTGTVASNGAVIADNDIVNLPYTLRHRGVIELAGIHQLAPAICVSTGPSLQQHIHLLKDIQGKVLIIAVAQALRPLLAYGIKPDFICTVDYGKPNIGHFEGLMDCDIPLICLNRTYAPILKRYKGPKFIVATPTPGFENTAAGILRDKGYLEQGGSVSHMVLGLALHMGCDPITMVGLDLSYSDELTSHTKQADAQGKIEIDENGLLQWVIQDPRSPIYNKKSCMGRACYVPGYYGKSVVTNLGLQSFITSFEFLIKRRKQAGDIRTVYNSTEGGCHIPGTERIPLKEFIETKCLVEPIKSNIEKLLSLPEDADKEITEAIPLLEQDIKNLNKIIEHSTKALKTNKKLRKHRKMPKAEIKKLLKKNEKLSNEANKASEKNCLVTLAIYGASRAIHTRKLEVKGKTPHLLKNAEDFDTRLNRNELILTAAKNAAKSLKKSYKESLSILKKYNKTKDSSLLESNEKEEVTFDDVDIYFDAGNFTHPLLDAKKVLLNPDNYDYDIKQKAKKILSKAGEMKRKTIEKGKELLNTKSHNLIIYNDLIEQSKIEGRDNKNFDKAMELIDKAIELFPEREEALWGKASAYYYIKKYEDALEIYEKLLKLDPDNYRYYFEKCMSLLQLGDTTTALKELGKLMNTTDEYNYFLLKIGDLYQEVGILDEAVYAYKEYLKLFPMDYKGWKKYSKCLFKCYDTLKRKNIKVFNKAIKASAKSKKIKGNFILTF